MSNPKMNDPVLVVDETHPLKIKVAVAGMSGEGPVIAFYMVHCNDHVVNRGDHYEAAQQAASDAGIDDISWACDMRDPAWKFLNVPADAFDNYDNNIYRV